MMKGKGEPKVARKKEDKKAIEPKRLYRSKEDKLIAGVCGGVAEYFTIDPVWVRLAAVLLVLLDGIGIIIYVLAWILVPANPNQVEKKKTEVEKIVEDVKSSHEAHRLEKRMRRRGKGAVIFGLIIVMIGVGFLFRNMFSWWSFKYLWPALLILLGLYLIMRSRE